VTTTASFLRPLFVSATLVLALGCAKEKSAEDVRPTFTEAEAERGRKACASYSERICACAANSTALNGDCDLARSQPEALELALRAVYASGKREKEDQWALDQNARRIIEKCVESDLKLDPQTCPRVESNP